MTIDETGLPPEDFESPTEEVVEVRPPMEKVRRWATKDWSVAKKKRKACELRLMGYEFRAISKIMGISLSSAYQLVNAALKACPMEPAKNLRMLKIQQFNRVMRALYPRAISGTKDGDRAAELFMRAALESCKFHPGLLEDTELKNIADGIKSIRDMLNAHDTEPSDKAEAGESPSEDVRG